MNTATLEKVSQLLEGGKACMEKERKQYDDVKPVLYKAVRVWLSDGTRIIAMWTGSRWWSAKGEVNPVKWELEIRKRKTEKLLKKLPGSERPEAGHSAADS
jgi:hypothetical protein